MRLTDGELDYIVAKYCLAQFYLFSCFLNFYGTDSQVLEV